MKGVWLQCLDCLQKFIRLKKKKKRLDYSQTLHFYLIWAVWPFDVCFWPEGDTLHLFACTVGMEHNEAWENLHCGWCKNLHFFFVSLERREDSKVHFKEQSPLLSPSQTEAQQSRPRTADGTVCPASLEISESSARKGRTWGWLFHSFSWILPSACVYLAQQK